MPELLAPLAVSLMIFFCTFAAAVSGMIMRKKLPVDHLSEDSKDVKGFCAVKPHRVR